MLKAWTIGLMGALACSATPQSGLHEGVIVKDEAWVLLEPKAVSSGQVISHSWSKRGKYLSTIRQELLINAETIRGQQDLQFRTVLAIYDLAKSTERIVYRSNSMQERLMISDWAHDEQSLYFTVQEPSKEPDLPVSARLIRASITGQSRTIESLLISKSTFFFAQAFPTQDAVIVQTADSEHRKAYVLTPQGKWPTVSFSNGNLFFDGSGKRIIVSTMAVSAAPSGAKPTRTYYELTQQGLTPTEATSRVYSPPDTPDVGLEYKISSKTETVGKLKRTINYLWLESRDASDYKRALVAVDAKNPEFSPAMNAISYQVQGMVLVRSMVKMDRKLFEEANLAAIRNQIMSNSKQSALAALMYSADHDDKFPMKELDYRSLFFPYLKDYGVVEDFVLVFPGGPANVPNPAETIMGYIKGPGGRAVAYMDGHVRWIKDP
jgi:hypothetical protein